jgi:membrane dipeptidase
VPDDVLRRLPANGGIVMVTFVPAFVSQEVMAHDAEDKAEQARLEVRFPGQKAIVREHLEAWRGQHPRPRATVQQVADHIAHVVQVAGIDHVGIGSDFDGIKEGPRGLESVADYPNLLAELLHRGFSEDQVEKIAGRNLLRVLRAAEQVAARATRAPAETRLEPSPAAGTSR